ncbi:hypothetical protein RvY_03949 [Ramazzottius varieornatus]|uniref:Uncharacterized protein n=1 Tax=Ramazzottius varieornatus TaxID=947166 RepID=A0A1D1UZ60_RAMVA|nr:hypothetical protein RvY_03949 [Ramazzottius varieornatus]
MLFEQEVSCSAEVGLRTDDKTARWTGSRQVVSNTFVISDIRLSKSPVARPSLDTTRFILKFPLFLLVSAGFVPRQATSSVAEDVGLFSNSRNRKLKGPSSVRGGIREAPTQP